MFAQTLTDHRLPGSVSLAIRPHARLVLSCRRYSIPSVLKLWRFYLVSYSYSDHSVSSMKGVLPPRHARGSNPIVRVRIAGCFNRGLRFLCSERCSISATTAINCGVEHAPTRAKLLCLPKRGRFLNRWSAVRLCPGPPFHLTESALVDGRDTVSFQASVATSLPGCFASLKNALTNVLLCFRVCRLSVAGAEIESSQPWT
jgi:hypothetical protein